MSAPTIVGEPCGCQVLEEPQLTATQMHSPFSPLTDRQEVALFDWFDQHVEGWRSADITAIAYGDGVLSMQCADRVVLHNDHLAQHVLMLNTEPPPISE